MSGSITGLSEGYLLLSNGLDEVTVKAEGVTTFKLSDLPKDARYDIRIVNDTLAQFALQCDVVNGAGIMAAKPVSDALVRCARVQSVRLLAGAVPPTMGRDGLGNSAQFVSPAGMAQDAAGNIYVADTDFHTIRKITPNGQVSTLAGTGGQPGSADGTGADARFNAPFGLAIDKAGNLIVADTNNHAIRRVRFNKDGSADVSLLAGQPGTLGSVDGQAGAARFNQPMGIALDPSSGDILVADTGSHTIRRIDANGNVSTVAGKADKPGMDAKSVPVTTALFREPQALAVDTAGAIYVADTGNHLIRKIDRSVVTVLAGDPGNQGDKNGNCAAARFNSPQGLVVTGSGEIFVADTGNATIRRIGLSPAACEVTTVAGIAGKPGVQDSTDPKKVQFDQPLGIVLTAAGDLVVSDYLGGTIRRVNKANGTASALAGKAEQFGSVDDVDGTKARFNFPAGLAIAPDGSIYTADSNNNTIRRILPTGQVVTLVDPDKGLDYPTSVAVASNGQLYVSDTGNNMIRRVSLADGTVTTLAEGFSSPQGLALSKDEQYLYVADTENNRIRRITVSDGHVITWAGITDVEIFSDGDESQATFFMPSGVAIDADGNVIVADSGNYLIRRIMPSSTSRIVDGIEVPGVTVSTVAGAEGIAGYEDGKGAAAQFKELTGITQDGAGNIYVIDGSSIRSVSGTSKDSEYLVQTFIGHQTTDYQTSRVTLGPLPRSLGTPLGLAFSKKKIYFTSGDAVLFIDR
ncbi:MAG: SMP-30/gluconolactonase/LRE family protein [Leptothrix sp. (in: b-proteobacteria)]